MRRFIGSTLAGFALALAVAAPAAAHPATITPGAFCKKSEQGTHAQDSNGLWYVCSYDSGYGEAPRWHRDAAYQPPSPSATPTPRTSPTPTPTRSASSTPTPRTSSTPTPSASSTPTGNPTPTPADTALPTTGPGGPTGPLVLAGVALAGILAGAALLIAARRRRATA